MQASTPFKFKIIHQLDDFKQLEPHWQRLLRHCPTHGIFQTWTWQYCWLSVFKPRVTLWVVTLWQQNQLQAIAPLYLDNKKVLHLIGNADDDSQACDNGRFICHAKHPQAIKQLMEILLEHKSQWQELRLHNLYEHNNSYTYITDYLNRQKYPFIDSFLYDAYSRVLGNTQADQQLLKQKKLIYAQHEFSRNDQFFYQHLTEPAAINAQLPEFVSQHQQYWQTTKQISKLTNPKYIEFFQQLNQAFADKNVVHLSFLRLNQMSIAACFSFYYQQRYLHYAVCHNRDYSENSAELLFQKYLLKHLMSLNCRECDYSIGAETYQYELSNKVYKVKQLRIFSQYHRYSLQSWRLALKKWINTQLCKLHQFERGA